MKKALTIFLCASACLFLAGTSGAGERGRYFAKKAYDKAALPDYTAVRRALPGPVLDGNPGWLDMYWKCWELAFSHIKKPLEGAPFVSNYLDEAFNPNIFQWDTIFMMMFARYAHHVFPAIQSLDNFYCRQRDDGYICREIVEKDGADYIYLDSIHTVNPPLFSWAEVESYQVTGDKTRFKRVLPVLEKYAEWLETGRKKPGTAHGLYWQTGLGSGMDNTPRSGSGWTDMSCQVAMLYTHMASMARELGLKKKARGFEEKAGAIGKRINQWMWDEKDGLYYDVDDKGAHVKWKTAGCFWPMLSDIASQKQAERLVAHLRNPDEFWRTIPYPTLAADQEQYDAAGKYWLGGVWAPTNWAVIKGLEKAGYEDLAARASERYVQGMYRVFKETGTVWELYAPDQYKPGTKSDGKRLCRKDFVGWSGIGPIALLFENIMGIRCNGAGNRIAWRLRRTDRHGINNLHFGRNVVSLVCGPRKKAESAAKIDVKAELPFKLTVIHPKGTRTFNLKAGGNKINVP